MCNGARVNKDRTSCEFCYPSITSVLTTLETYGTSLDLVLWRVLASSRKYLRDFFCGVVYTSVGVV